MVIREPNLCSYKVYHSPNPPDFSNPPSVEVRTNEIAAPVVALDLIDFVIEMPTILLPDDSSSVSVPITITADQACELTGVSFAWAFDQDLMSIDGLTLEPAWSAATPPSFSMLVAINDQRADAVPYRLPAADEVLRRV